MKRASVKYPIAIKPQSDFDHIQTHESGVNRRSAVALNRVMRVGFVLLEVAFVLVVGLKVVEALQQT